MAERLPARPLTTPVLRSSDLRVHPTGSPLGRIYFASGPHPANWDTFRHYGPLPVMRFDHQPKPVRLHPTRAITYLAPAHARRNRKLDPLLAAVRETFAAGLVIDVATASPWFVLWYPVRPLHLLDFVDGPWISRVGGNTAISSGVRGVSRDWSRAIDTAYPDVDGLYYETSSTPTARSVAAYERARDVLPPAPALNVPLAHSGLRPALRRIADTYDMYLTT